MQGAAGGPRDAEGQGLHVLKQHHIAEFTQDLALQWDRSQNLRRHHIFAFCMTLQKGVQENVGREEEVIKAGMAGKPRPSEGGPFSP